MRNALEWISIHGVKQRLRVFPHAHVAQVHPGIARPSVIANNGAHKFGVIPDMERKRIPEAHTGGQSYRASLGPSQDGWAAGQQMSIVTGKSHPTFGARMKKKSFLFGFGTQIR